MKVVHHHPASRLSPTHAGRAPTKATAKNQADTFSLTRSRQVVRKWLHLPEPKKKHITMDGTSAAAGAAVGGAACLACLCSPVLAVLGIVCLPCIGCFVGSSLLE